MTARYHLAGRTVALGAPTVARGRRADVQDLTSLQTAMNAAADHFGRIDVIIANAGVDVIQALATADPAAFERVVAERIGFPDKAVRAELDHARHSLRT